MHTLRVAISVAGLVTIASPRARAQEPDTLTPAQRAGLALARLGAGQRVRIVTRDSRLVEGSVMATSSNLVRLRTDGSLMDLPSRVDSLWVRSGSHAGTGALIGGAVGVAGTVRLVAAFSGCRECGSIGAARVAAGVVVFGGGAALLGALIGAPFPKWQQRAGSALAGLRVGQRVRIRTGDGLVQGWISNSPNLVTLRTADGSTIEVPAPGVDSLWVRGTHARTGALMGAVAGFALGAFGTTSTTPYTARNTVAGGLGIVGGALVGAIIGAAVPKWQLRVP